MRDVFSLSGSGLVCVVRFGACLVVWYCLKKARLSLTMFAVCPERCAQAVARTSRATWCLRATRCSFCCRRTSCTTTCGASGARPGWAVVSREGGRCGGGARRVVRGDSRGGHLGLGALSLSLHGAFFSGVAAVCVFVRSQVKLIVPTASYDV